MQHEWRKLRADELRDQARREAIVILPVASLEQHGRICRSKSTLSSPRRLPHEQPRKYCPRGRRCWFRLCYGPVYRNIT